MQRSRARVVVVLHVAAITAAFVACGSDGDAGPGPDTASSSSSSSSSSSGGGSSSSSSSGGGSTSSSGGATDGGADADAFVPIQGLDPTFGTNGFTASNAFEGHDYLDVMARQSTGKIVVVGINGFNPYSTVDQFSDLVLSRLTTAGQVDTTFGSSGTRLVHIGLSFLPEGAAAQSDDKIVVVGRTVEPDKNAATLALVRFTADGALDTTFGGGDGWVLDGYGEAKAVAMQSDGKILVAVAGTGKLDVIRYTSAGVRDTTYGTSGVADAGSGSTVGMVLQPDGKAVIVGTGYDANISKSVTTVARFTTAGVLDTSFDATGVVSETAAGGVASTARGVALDSAGNILVESVDVSGNDTYSRFTSAGVLDTAYGTNGFITLTTLDHYFVAQPDGKIVVAHRASLTTELRRYDTAGALDTTYGASGIAETPLPLRVYVQSMLLAPNGDVYAGGGGAFSAFDWDWMVVSRASADGTVDTTYGTNGNAKAGAVASRESALGVVVQNDGKIMVAGGIKDFWHRGFFQRYDTNGAPDGTFGAGGFKEIADYFDFEFAGFALTAGGKFLVAKGPNTQDAFEVVQYAADGTRDNAYGSSGVASLAAGTSTNQGPLALAVDGTGRAVLAGAWDDSFALVRFTTGGATDTTFGGGAGYVKGKVAASGTNEVFQAVAVRADGKIVASGHSGTAMLVARFGADGTPDSTFDGDGYATFTKQGFDARAVLLQPNDAIIVVGVEAMTSTPKLTLVRLTDTGALDTTWNGTGTVTEAMTSSVVLGVSAPARLAADGSVIVAFAATTAGQQDMVVERYTSSGVLDATFGTAGRLPLPLSIGEDIPTAMALQADGKVVITGRTFTSTGGTDVALLRLK